MENKQKEQLKAQQLHKQPASETNQYQHRSHYVSKPVQSSPKVNAATHDPTNRYIQTLVMRILRTSTDHK